jgi:hypothetical protein
MRRFPVHEADHEVGLGSRELRAVSNFDVFPNVLKRLGSSGVQTTISIEVIKVLKLLKLLK